MSFDEDVLGMQEATEPPVADDDYQYLVHEQMVTEAVIPKFSSILSIFGSALIITEVILDHRSGQMRDGATSRILLSLGVADIFFSFAYLLGTIPAPKDLVYIWGNVGNTATCTFQGFILQLGWVSSPLFSVMLAVFFLLRVKYRWTDTRLRRIEPWVHGSIWLFALFSAILPIPLEMYNNSWGICWIESYPEGCLDSHRHGDEATCTRGDNAWILATFYQVFPVWFCVLLSVIIMGMIIQFVREIESKVSKYAGSMKQSEADNSRARSRAGSVVSSILAKVRGGSGDMTNDPSRAGDAATRGSANASTVKTVNVTDRKKSQQVATQACYYIGAFLFAYTLDLIAGMLWYVAEIWNFWLDTFAYFLLPLLGFFNFCVFCRTRKMKSRVGIFTRKIVCCLEGRSLCGGTPPEIGKESARANASTKFTTNRTTAYSTSKTMNDTIVQENSIVERNPETTHDVATTTAKPQEGRLSSFVEESAPPRGNPNDEDGDMQSAVTTGSVDMGVDGRIAV